LRWAFHSGARCYGSCISVVAGPIFDLRLGLDVPQDEDLTNPNSLFAGMPTWDNLDWTKPEYGGEEIVYTTPFYINPQDTLVKTLVQTYKARFYSRPSDMVFRGYETVYRFGKLLALHGGNLSGSIGEKKFKVFNDLEITPVFLNKQSMTLDYFENKKLYFIKKMDGSTVVVN